MNEVDQLKKIISEQAKLIKEQSLIIDQLTVENKLLRQKTDFLLKRYFGGSKSEKINFDQLELFKNSSFLGFEQKPVDNISKNKNKQSKKKVRKQQKLPDNLPEKQNIIIPEEVKKDPDSFRCIGEECSTILDISPSQIIKVTTIRKKFVRKNNPYSPPIIADLPAKLIEKSFASPSLLTYIIISKYLYHLPLYRLEKKFKDQHAITLSRKTMSDWVAVTADWLKMIYLAMKEEVKKGKYLQIDETPVKYMTPYGSKKGFFWVYITPSGNRIFEWHTGRSHTCLDGMLSDYHGVIHSDDYGAYDCYIKKHNNIILLLCWAHARRRFHEALESYPDEAKWFLKQIQNLYLIEKRLRLNNVSPKLKEIIRQNESSMILKRIKKAFILKLPKHTRKTDLLRKAISYALNGWGKLTEYINHGVAEIDNNLVENAIRPVALGKKNWLFIGHPEAGEKSAIIYSILESCKAHGINSSKYLQDVLTRLPSMKNHEAADYTPAKWATRKKNSSKKVA